MAQPVVGSVVCGRARTLLSDSGSTFWDDTALMRFVDVAFPEVQVILRKALCPIMRKWSTAQTVNSGTLTVGAAITDMVEPIKLTECAVSAGFAASVDMNEVGTLPRVAQTTTLRYWSWNGASIDLIGASANRDVFVRYWRSIDTPASSSGSLVIPQVEVYLTPRVAALAYESIGQNELAKELNQTALDSIAGLITVNKGQMVGKRT